MNQDSLRTSVLGERGIERVADALGNEYFLCILEQRSDLKQFYLKNIVLYGVPVLAQWK